MGSPGSDNSSQAWVTLGSDADNKVSHLRVGIGSTAPSVTINKSLVAGDSGSGATVYVVGGICSEQGAKFNGDVTSKNIYATSSINLYSTDSSSSAKHL